MFRRQIINIDDFHRIYGNKPGFYDTEYVAAGGDTPTALSSSCPGMSTPRRRGAALLQPWHRRLLGGR
jgi:hypothetical protein